MTDKLLHVRHRAMAKKPIRTLSLGALALLLVSSPLWLWRVLPTGLARTAPVVVRYVENGEAEGSRPDQLTLWVSNRTDLPLMVCFAAVEVGAGSTWTNFSQSPGLLVLKFSQTVGKPAEVIGPHQAEEAMSFQQPLPQAGQWRVKVLALARESRTQKLLADSRLLLRRLHLLPRRGDANVMPLVTLPGGRPQVEVYRPLCEAVSEEVRALRPADSLPKASPVGVRSFSRATPEAIAKARAALDQKLKELDEAATTRPAAPLK